MTATGTIMHRSHLHQRPMVGLWRMAWLREKRFVTSADSNGNLRRATPGPFRSASFCCKEAWLLLKAAPCHRRSIAAYA